MDSADNYRNPAPGDTVYFTQSFLYLPESRKGYRGTVKYTMLNESPPDGPFVYVNHVTYADGTLVPIAQEEESEYAVRLNRVWKIERKNEVKITPAVGDVVNVNFIPGVYNSKFTASRKRVPVSPDAPTIRMRITRVHMYDHSMSDVVAPWAYGTIVDTEEFTRLSGGSANHFAHELYFPVSAIVSEAVPDSVPVTRTPIGLDGKSLTNQDILDMLEGKARRLRKAEYRAKDAVNAAHAALASARKEREEADERIAAFREVARV